MDKQPVDVAIIGAGTAGMVAYQRVRKVTDKVVLIEGDQYGTTCARVGCMPSKLLIAAAENAHQMELGKLFGVSAGGIRIDGRRVMERVRTERDRFVSSVIDSVEKFPEAHRLKGHARFVGPHRLLVEGNREVQAERIIIATGSRPNIPGFLKEAKDRLVVNDDIFEWQDLPDSVAVFGPGVIGLELGQALSRLGVRVRMFGVGGSVGPIQDDSIRDYALKTFNGLDIQNADIELDENGMPRFDPHTLRCGQSHIFIAGDANNSLPLLHEAADEGRIAGENAASYPDVRTGLRRTPLAVVFTDPQIATVGLTIHQVGERCRGYFAVGEVSFEDQGRSRVISKNRGLLRVYGEHGSGLFMGAEMFGPAAEHIAHLLAWSAQRRLTVTEMLEMPFYHPVIEEGLRTALKDLNRNLSIGPAPEEGCTDCGPGV